MGTNTLTNRNAGDTIQDTFFNSIHASLNGDLVGRGSTGVPTAGQNLGTVAIPWGTVRADTIIIDGQAIDPTQLVAPQNRVVSGKTRSTSNQPAFIVPSGSGASFTIDGTPTNLVLDINGVSVTVNTDIVKSSLTLAPSSQNTALVNDTEAADQAATRLWGEVGNPKPITIDTVGTNITALVGKWAAFKIAGVGTEYFLAYVNSATQLTNCFRGYFYNPSITPMNRTEFSNNDTITLMSLGWIFVENDATTVDVTYSNPTWSFTSPNSPATGDYWYDMANNLWKRYDGASFQIINRTFIGMVILDTTDCVGARCDDFYAAYRDVNDIALQVQTTEIVRTRGSEARCSVAGREIRFQKSIATWNITTDLATSADMYDGTEQASRIYYVYLKDDGDTVISDIEPYRRPDFYGDYHPHNPWRMVGTFYNDGGSDIVAAIGITQKLQFFIQNTTPTASSFTSGTAPIIFPDLGTSGYDNAGAAYDFTNGQYTFLRPGYYDISCTMSIIETASADFQANIRLYKNGTSTIIIGGSDRYETSITQAKNPSFAGKFYFMPGDYVTVTPFTNAGGSFGGAEELNYLFISQSADL